jgi:hypothetical protein
MKTAIGAPDPGEFERRQPHNLFNDRRVGGKAKNRASLETYHAKPVKKASGGQSPPQGPNDQYQKSKGKPKPSNEKWPK